MLEWLSSSFQILSRADIRYVLFTLILYITSVSIYAVRWIVVLRKVGVKLRFRDSFAAYLASILVNNITPSARAGGEVMRIAYAYIKTSTPMIKLLNTVAFERICESVPVISLAAIAIFEALVAGDKPIGIIIEFFLIVAGVATSVKYWDKILAIAARKLGFGNNLDSSVSIKRLVKDRSLFIVTVVLSSIVWVLDVLRLYTAALAVGWEAPPLRFALASVMYLVVGLLAVTPGGIGIVESGLTAVFIALGASPSVALATVMIERLISYGFASLIGLLVIIASGGPQAWTLLRSRWRQTGFTPR